MKTRREVQHVPLLPYLCDFSGGLKHRRPFSAWNFPHFLLHCWPVLQFLYLAPLLQSTFSLPLNRGPLSPIATLLGIWVTESALGCVVLAASFRFYQERDKFQKGLNFFLSSFSCICVYAQSCPTICSPMDGSPPGSFVHGILQARTLEWVVISSSRGSS